MNRILAVLLLLLLTAGAATAQTEQIARLQQRAATATDPQQKLAAGLELLQAHESLFKDSLLPLAQRTLDLARSLGNERAVGDATVGLVNAHLRLDHVQTADSLIRVASPRYPVQRRQLAPVGLQLRLAGVSVRAARADYEGAVRELLDIVRDAERVGDTGALTRAFNELGVIAYNRNELDGALGYYRKAIALAGAGSRAAPVQAYAYINIAQVYAWREQYDTALQYIHLAKPLCEALQNLYYLANAWLVEADIYKWSGRMKEAEAAMLQVVALRTRTEGRLTFSNEQLGLANFYVYARDFDKAIATYRSGLAYAAALQQSGTPANYELELRYYEGLAKSYQSLGARDDYEQALRQIILLKDSLYEQNSAVAISEMQTKYEVQKKEATILAQRLDIARKNFLFYGALLLIVLGGVIGWLLFRAYRRRSRLRLFLLREEEKRRAEQAVKDAEEGERRRIAADLHDSLGSYAASIKSNAEEMKRSHPGPLPALDLLQTNARQMVSLLSDTIWAMRRNSLRLSDTSDRLKLVLQRLRPNYPDIVLRVEEELETDPELPPVHGYHLFMILQEGVNNALRHSGASRVIIYFQGGSEWSVRVTDNGQGLNGAATADGGNGLYNMKARAGSMGCRIEWQRVDPSGTAVVLQPNPY